MARTIDELRMKLLGVTDQGPGRQKLFCYWAGEHSEDPTPVTVLVMGRPCGHDEDAGDPAPTCSKHLQELESRQSMAEVLTECSVCGTASKLAVIGRAPAR